MGLKKELYGPLPRSISMFLEDVKAFKHSNLSYIKKGDGGIIIPPPISQKQDFYAVVSPIIVFFNYLQYLML